MPRPRPWPRRIAIAGILAAAALLPLVPSAKDPGGAARIRASILATNDTAIPDDDVLIAQLQKAIDLRRREDFDRMLDARDPGELLEHATLSEVALDRNVLGPDVIFLVGDELFGYAFRPENGWGNGGADRK